MILAALAIFSYCTLWLITPLINLGVLNKLFLDINFLIYGPPLLLVFGGLGVAAFLALGTRKKKTN